MKLEWKWFGQVFDLRFLNNLLKHHREWYGQKKFFPIVVFKAQTVLCPDFESKCSSFCGHCVPHTQDHWCAWGICPNTHRHIHCFPMPNPKPLTHRGFNKGE